MKPLSPLFALLFACGSDAGAPGADVLVGSWSTCAGIDQDELPPSFTFNADGTFAARDGDLVGSFEVDGDLLRVDATGDGGRLELEVSWYANRQFLVISAAYPDGDHDGPVGTWNSHSRLTRGALSFGFERTLELRADNSATVRDRDLDGDELSVYEGTWGPDSINPGGFEVEVELDGFTVRTGFEVVDGAVIGLPTHCRD